MDVEDMKRGMKVKISRGQCTATKDTCTITTDMENLRGSTATVTDFHSDGMVKLDNGWTWNPKDLFPLHDRSKKIPKTSPPKIQFFDEQRLWT